MDANAHADRFFLHGVMSPLTLVDTDSGSGMTSCDNVGSRLGRQTGQPKFGSPPTIASTLDHRGPSNLFQGAASREREEAPPASTAAFQRERDRLGGQSRRGSTKTSTEGKKEDMATPASPASLSASSSSWSLFLTDHQVYLSLSERQL